MTLKPCEGFELRKVNSIADYQAVANSTESLEKIEECMKVWIKQIEQVCFLFWFSSFILLAWLTLLQWNTQDLDKKSFFYIETSNVVHEKLILTFFFLSNKKQNKQKKETSLNFFIALGYGIYNFGINISPIVFQRNVSLSCKSIRHHIWYAANLENKGL